MAAKKSQPTPPPGPRRFKLGANAAVFEQRHISAGLHLADAFDSLGTPPANSTNWTNPVVAAIGDDWGIMGNDEVGDCMIAECGHAIMQTSANSGTMIQPDTQVCLDFYKAESGWNGFDGDPSDAGTDEVTLTDYLAKNDFDGVKLMAHAPIHIHNLDHVKWTIQKFCGCRFNIRLPASAYDQFTKGEPWDVMPMHQDGGIVGGHSIFGTHYHGQYFYAVTWGKLIPVTPAFLHRYLFEAHAEIWSSLLNSAGTWGGETNAQLIADLIKINQAK